MAPRASPPGRLPRCGGSRSPGPKSEPHAAKRERKGSHRAQACMWLREAPLQPRARAGRRPAHSAGAAYATDAFRSPLSGLDFPGLNTFSSLQILLWCPMGEKSMNVVERTWQAAGFFVNHLSVAPAPRALRRVTAWWLQASPARPRRWPRTSSPRRPRSQVNPLLGDVKCNLELAPSGQRSGNKILELF